MNRWIKGILSVVAVASCMATQAEEAAAASVQPDWYLQIDVKALKASRLAEELNTNEPKGLNLLNLVVGEQLLNQVNYLMVKGGLGEQDAKIALIQGDFASHKKQLNEKWAELGFTTQLTYEKADIYHGKLKSVASFINNTNHKLNVDQQLMSKADKQQFKVHIDESNELDTELYAALRADNIIILSDDVAVVKQWLSENIPWNPSQQNRVFEVVVDVQKAMLNGGVNIDQENDNFQFESISAKQVSQASVAYTENSGFVDFQLGLKTLNIETATRIKSVAQGLIALKMLSDSNRAVLELLSSIHFEQDADSLLLKVSGPIESFKALLEH